MLELMSFRSWTRTERVTENCARSWRTSQILESSCCVRYKLRKEKILFCKSSICFNYSSFMAIGKLIGKMSHVYSYFEVSNVILVNVESKSFVVVHLVNTTIDCSVILLFSV